MDLRDLVLAVLHSLGGEASRLRLRVVVLTVLSAFGDLGLERLGSRGSMRWDRDVDAIMDWLASNGFLVVLEGGMLRLTEKGAVEAVLAVRAIRSMGDRVAGVLDEYSSFASRLSDDELLLYAYVVHGVGGPGEAVDRVLAMREELALRMLERGVVSVSMAAALAGISYRAFVEYAARKGVRMFYASENDLVDAAAGE